MVLEYIFAEGTASPYDLMYEKVHSAPEDPVVIDTSETLSAATPPTQSMVRTSVDRIYVVYKRKLGTKYQIYVKYSDDEGDTWSARFLISDAAGMAGYSQIGQCIAVDSEDNLHVVWNGRATGYTKDQIWYRKYDGSWGSTTHVDPRAEPPIYDQSAPSIAIDSGDILHLAWSQFTTVDYVNKIYYTKYNGSWATPILISTAAGMETTWSQYTPVLAIDSSDYLHIVWRGRATGFTTNEQIWYATAVPPYAAGNWVTPIRISTETGMETQNQRAACIAIDSGDNLHVVWYGKAAATFNKIWYVKYDGSWSTPIVISTTEGMENYDQQSPVITLGSTSDLHVIWEGKATGYTDQNKIWYATYTSSWITPEVIQPTGKSSYSNIRWSRWPYESAFVDSSSNLFIRLEVGQNSADLLIRFEVGQDSANLLHKTIIRNEATVELPIQTDIRQPSSVELLGKVDITHSVNLLGKTNIRHMGTPMELFGRVGITHSVELLCKMDITHSVDLLARIEVGQDSQDLLGKTEVGQGNQDLLGKVDITHSIELLGKVDITHSIDLLARAEVGQGSQDLLGKVDITHSVNLLGKINITHSIELLGRVVIRHTGTPIELPGKGIIRHEAVVELLGKCIIRHSDSKDLDANVEICHWEDLYGKTKIRHTATPFDLPATFWIRQPYRLWTNRRYLNGVVELTETLIGNAILEYVIEGVMQDIQSYLINAGLGYSEWTDIILTPRLIRRATTYGAVAALYARRARTFAARVIPTIAPITITVIGDEERAMNHWRGKMNKALEYYVTSQDSDVMISSTEDEEPVFSMDDIPPTVTDYTPWYEWLMQRER